MTSLVVLSLLAGVPLPQECEPPPLHDVAPLKTFAQKSGTLSVGLDSVATWCFDSGGAWTGGQRPEPGKKPKPIDPKAPPVGDCARALTACEDARVALTGELMQTLLDALGDLERPYRGQKYPPKRTGLNERPPTNVNCKERSRPDLFAQAQARMDLARLASTVQNEYANYKTWLFARGLECGQQVRSGKVDTTRVAVSVDSPIAPVTAGGAAGKGTGGGSATTIATTTTNTSGTAVATTTAAGTTATATISRPGSGASPTTPTAGTTPGTATTPTGTTAGTTGTTGTGSTSPTVASPNTGTSGPATTTGSTGTTTAVAANPGASTSKPPTTGAGSTPTTTPGTTTFIAGANTGTAKGAQSWPATSPSTANPSGTPDIGAAPVLPPPVVTTPTGTSGTPVGTTGTTGTTVATATTPNTTTTSPLGTPAEAPSTPNNAMLETWRALAAQRGKMELDRDYTLGFLASRELRDCRCQRSSPAGIVTRLESGEATAQLESDNQRAVACEHCLQNAFAAWRGRVQKQCSLMGELSEYELEVLQRSDDGNGIPPRCWQDIVSKRGLDAGVFLATPTVTAKPPPVQTTMTVPLPTADAGSKTIVAAGPVQPLSPPPTGMPRFEPTSTLADGFFRPSEPAPIPLREDGRLYVRVFMSSTCAADVLPGPVLARTGDLLLIPWGARQLSLRSPCGGLAEVYWGREATPRVSEVFGRNQPLHLQFKPQ